MHVLVFILAGLMVPASLALREAPRAETPARHGVPADRETYPQGTPKEALASVLKAIDLKRIDYLLAHLAEPEWVDGRVDTYAGGFKDLVAETGERLDPGTVKRLKRFAKEGEAETLDTTVILRHKDFKDVVVRLRKINGRWYLQNNNKP